MEAYRQKSHIIIIIIQNGFETNLDILLPYMGNGIWLEFKDYRKMVQMVQYYDDVLNAVNKETRILPVAEEIVRISRRYYERLQAHTSLIRISSYEWKI